MNPKLIEHIHTFAHFVGWYLQNEYDSIYYEQFAQNDLFDFIGSYYMGGSTVPETARYVVDFINIRLD